MKILKTLHEWPLSKVELVEVKGKKFVLKTIHKDFASEVNRQKILEKKCQIINVPKIAWVKKGEKVSFLMDYVPHTKKVSRKKSLDIIKKFHLCTIGIQSKHFHTYNNNSFLKDFKKVKRHLPRELSKKNSSEIKKFFAHVFNSKYSIVHGDWGTDQILSHKKTYIVDFGKSFYGPSILDYAHLELKKKNTKDEVLIKAKIVCAIIILSWFELCKRKYINYDYKKEIKKYVGIIKYNLGVLK